MIVRVWSGRVETSDEKTYMAHLTGRVFPALRTIDGFLGCSLLKENRADGVEFMVISKWSSMDAVRVFAGPDVSKAVIDPAATAVLVEYDKIVRHYEVAAEISGAERQ